MSDVPALAVKGLLAGYGQARVLHGLDFALARGEMVVVIGRKGVGKNLLDHTSAALTFRRKVPGPFHPLNINGVAAGKKNCLFSNGPGRDRLITVDAGGK